MRSSNITPQQRVGKGGGGIMETFRVFVFAFFIG